MYVRRYGATAMLVKYTELTASLARELNTCSRICMIVVLPTLRALGARSRPPRIGSIVLLSSAQLLVITGAPHANRSRSESDRRTLVQRVLYNDCAVMFG
jgi:hypothetical protein